MRPATQVASLEGAVERASNDRLAFGFLTAFAVVMYAAPAEWIPVTAPLRPALTTSVLAISLMVMSRLRDRAPVYIDGGRGAALVAFCALGLASFSWSIAPEHTRTSALELLKLGAIYLALVNLVSTPRRLSSLSLALVLASIVTSIGAINWYLGGVDLVEGFRARWVGHYADPNRLAMSLVLVVPLAVAFAVRPGNLGVRLACAAAAGLAVTAIVFSHSRGSFIGLAIGLAVWLLRDRRFWPAAVVAVVCAALLLFAPKSFWQRTESVTSFREDASAMGRVQAWDVTARINKERPAIGVGFNTFQMGWSLYGDPSMRRAYGAHNVFLQVLAELGAAGFILFLAFIAGALSGAYGASPAPDQWLARAIFAALTGYLVCNLSSGFVLSSHLFFACGLAACAERVFRTPARSRASQADEQRAK